MNIQKALNKICEKQHLDYEEGLDLFRAMFEGHLSQAQSGALLMGLRLKGETGDELGAAVQVALERARLVQGVKGVRIDTCGTGGDGRSSFNCSTAVAFFLADMGIKVVKHGNRAVSSSCGSADVVEALGLPLLDDPAKVEQELSRTNFAFLFAPHFHPSFAGIAPLRKELGIRSIFNLMGPLLNPARPTHQILGVPLESFMPIMAEVLKKNNVQSAAVVHGAEGFDELTPCGLNRVIFIRDKGLKGETIDPEALGFRLCRPRDMVCKDREEALVRQKEILRGTGPGAMQDMVALNLGLAIHLLDSKVSMPECMDQARVLVRAGLKNLRVC
ncbi:anthranilate phosphoribosyltransferase [Desulfonatronovibrio hydrogenovorans]|uniref:anthranilate phosphoribosyltransferase n=1 Tax=Desulfonatronovibrio hydrogenovorans TaxID=53245 RepID=UPI0004912442|nr:anthranilate phosphoribosyltransferase [Desulfonatronovibrio hydrogenovorans]